MKAYLYYSKESFNKRIDVPRLKRTIADVLSAEFNCLSGVEAGDIVMIFCHEHNLRKVEKYFKTRSLW